MDDFLAFKNLVSNAKRNCKLCSTYRHLNPESKEKPLVQESLKQLYNFFLQEYNALRKKDAPSREIQEVVEHRRMILDTVDKCKNCDREVMLANQALRVFKF